MHEVYSVTFNSLQTMNKMDAFCYDACRKNCFNFSTILMYIYNGFGILILPWVALCLLLITNMGQRKYIT